MHMTYCLQACGMHSRTSSQQTEINPVLPTSDYIRSDLRREYKVCWLASDDKVVCGECRPQWQERCRSPRAKPRPRPRRTRRAVMAACLQHLPGPLKPPNTLNNSRRSAMFQDTIHQPQECGDALLLHSSWIAAGSPLLLLSLLPQNRCGNPAVTNHLPGS